MKIYVTDYSTVQDALDIAVHGDQVYFPGVQQYEAPPNGWQITKSIEIYGDGPGSASSVGTVLKSSTSPGLGHVFVLVPDAGTFLDNVHIRDLRIVGRGPGVGSGIGVTFAGSANQKLSDLRIERVAISGMGGAGISLIGYPAEGGHSTSALISDCVVEGCGGQGIDLNLAFQNCITGTRLAGNHLEALRATESQVILYVCGFDGSAQTEGDALVLLQLCGLARVDACRLEGFGAGSPRPALWLDRCRGVGNVGACVFDLGASTVANSRGIVVGGVLPGDGAVVILPNRCSGVETAVRVEDEAVACVVLPQHCVAAGATPIVLPSLPSDSPLAVPSFNAPSGNKLAGLLVPPFSSDPASNVQGGMLATVNGAVRTYVGGGTPGFKSIRRTPAPTPISDLAMGTVKGKTSLVVFWTAPAEPDWTGPVADYDLRYAQQPITEQNFSDATQANPQPVPDQPGTQQCGRVGPPMPLVPCTTYYFAIKSKDHSGQWSAISNVVSGQTRCSGNFEVDCP